MYGRLTWEMAAGSMLLLLDSIRTVNIKQACMIDRADWREKKDIDAGLEALLGEHSGWNDDDDDDAGLVKGKKSRGV